MSRLNVPIADEMEQAAADIENVGRNNKSWSILQAIIYNCSNHIRAEARLVRYRAEDFQREQESERENKS